MARSEKLSSFYCISKHGVAFGLLCILISVAAHIRIAGVESIPRGHFASNDAFLYYSQAQTILDNGKLPEVDTRRWVPTGRDLRQSLNGYAYALACAYKLIKICLPNTSLYQVQLYAPTFFFLVGLTGLCSFLYLRFGFSIAAVTGTFLAILPGTIVRSAAGFSDRDSWCLMLAVITITLYIAKEDITRKTARYVCTVISGTCIFLGGWSWEGFGGFIIAILTLEIWRMISTDTEENLSEYILWILIFVPTLYLLIPVYRTGGGWTTHATEFILVPPLVILFIRILRYVITHTNNTFSTFIVQQISTRALSIVLCAIGILGGIAYIALQRETFAQTILPFSSTQITGTIQELESPPDSFWYGRYGYVILITSITLVIGTLRIWRYKAIPIAVTLAGITTATFLRQYLYRLITPTVCEYLFYATIAFIPIAALGIAATRKQKVKHELIYIALATWAILWTALARDAIRYDFFIGVPIAFFAALGIQHFTTYTSKIIAENTRKEWMQHPTVNASIKTAIIIATIAIIFFWEPPGNPNAKTLMKRSDSVKIQPENVFPGRNTPIANACQWIREHLSEDNVMAAPWSYGHILNTLGGIKTIIDPDHFILNRIQHYQENVLNTTSEKEALQFLKTHHVTHLLLTENNVFYVARQRNKNQTNTVPLISRAPRGSTKTRYEPLQKRTKIDFVEIEFPHSTPVATAHFKSGDTVKIPYLKYENARKNIEKPLLSEINKNENGGILHFYEPETHQEAIYYLSSRIWNSLAIKMFFRNENSDALRLIYPEQQDENAKVKIWEIHYPIDIKENPKYLQR